MYYAWSKNSIPVDGEFGYVGNLPDDAEVFAFAYKEDERALNHICKPVKGRLKNGKYGGGRDKTFYEYKANGKDLKKNGVTIYARYFCDTYEEAVAGYNALIEKRIKYLRDETARLEDMLIR